MLDALSILVALAASFVWINDRFFGVSSTVAMMFAGVILAFSVVAVEWLGLEGISNEVLSGLVAIDFGPTLMNVVIGVLLYVAALKINLRLLEQQHALILILAVISTVINTFLTGFATWALLVVLGLDVPLLHCLLFGALISPTDPIATVAILKSVGLPEKLEVLIEGESLLNDGVGAVVFAVLIGIVATGQDPTLSHVGMELLRDVGGGLLLGVILGGVGGAMSRIDLALTSQVLVSLAIILFGGFLARYFHASYPLAMVAAGVTHALVVSTADTKSVKSHLQFWKTVEDVLIAGLFLMLGLLAIAPATPSMPLLAAIFVIPLVLTCRLISVWIGLWTDGRGKKTVKLPYLLTWGGLRGGISVALALSVPQAASRDIILELSYAVVLFSVLVQAPSIGRIFPPATLGNILGELEKKPDR